MGNCKGRLAGYLFWLGTNRKVSQVRDLVPKTIMTDDLAVAAELQATALNVKSKSRLVAKPEDYLLIQVKGGLDLTTIDDFSMLGAFWLTCKSKSKVGERSEATFKKGREDCYLIFGPTESGRTEGGDQQKLLNLYVRTHHRTTRVFILSTLMEVITIIHADIIKNYYDEEPDDDCFGVLESKNKPEAMIISNEDLTIFPVAVRRFLGAV